MTNIETILLTAIIALTSSITTSVISHWLVIRQLQKQNAQERRGVFLEKHIEACTKFWALLSPTSRYVGENRIVKQEEDSLYLDVKVTQQFCQDITGFFFSEHGIFMSQEFRDALFGTRDYLDSVISESKSKKLENIPLSKTKASKIEHCFKWLRETTRGEIAVKNLQFEKQEVGAK